MPTDEQLLAWWIAYNLESYPTEEQNAGIVLELIQNFKKFDKKRIVNHLAKMYREFREQFPYWQDYVWVQ